MRSWCSWSLAHRLSPRVPGAAARFERVRQPAQRALVPRLQRGGGAAVRRHRRAGGGQAVLTRRERDATRTVQLRGAAGCWPGRRWSSMPACIPFTRLALAGAGVDCVGRCCACRWPRWHDALRPRRQPARLPAARRAAGARRACGSGDARVRRCCWRAALAARCCRTRWRRCRTSCRSACRRCSTGCSTAPAPLAGALLGAVARSARGAGRPLAAHARALVRAAQRAAGSRCCCCGRSACCSRRRCRSGSARCWRARCAKSLARRPRAARRASRGRSWLDARPAARRSLSPAAELLAVALGLAGAVPARLQRWRGPGCAACCCALGAAALGFGVDDAVDGAELRARACVGLVHAARRCRRWRSGCALACCAGWAAGAASRPASALVVITAWSRWSRRRRPTRTTRRACTAGSRGASSAFMAWRSGSAGCGRMPRDAVAAAPASAVASWTGAARARGPVSTIRCRMSYYEHHIFFCLNQREQRRGLLRAARPASRRSTTASRASRREGLAGPGRRARQQGRLPRSLRRRAGGGGLSRSRLVHLRRPATTSTRSSSRI